MVLQLTFNEFLRLQGAKGAAIEVLDVVGAENQAHFARVEVRRSPSGSFSLIGKFMENRRAERTRRELAELSDHALRDIGLRRDEIRGRF